MRLTDIPLDRPVSTVMLLVCLVVLGGVAVWLLPLDFMPVVHEPEVDIEVPFPGSHPLEALDDVARPIEEELAAIPGVERLFVHTSAGRAGLEVEFDWSADVDLKKLEVREAVERARPKLPEGIGHIAVEGDIDSPAGGAILQGRISAERNLSESWEMLDRRIRRPLERIRGVARVSLYGVEPQQVRIDLDLQALKKHGVGPGELLETLEASNLDLDLGAVRGDLLRYDVRAVGRFRDLESIRDLEIGEAGARVRDLAVVTLEEPRLEYGRHLDRKFAVGIDVFKEPSANTVATVDRLLERIEEIQEDPLLRGVTLLIWNDAGEEIRRSIRGLRNAGIFGGVLAVSVLFLFLRRVRTTLVVAVAIPFSLLVTCGAMYLLDSQFDVLTMLGLMLGVGMLVDNAVVVMENIHRHQALGLAPEQASRRGTREVVMAVLASTATTVIVWSWLLITEKSTMTIYIGAVALTMCMAVICSLLISLTFIPLAAHRFVPRKPARPGFLKNRLIPGYRRCLAWTLRHRLVTLLLLAALAATAAFPFSRMEKTGEPAQRQNAVAINFHVHDASTKEVLEGYVDQVEGWLVARRDELRFENIYTYYQEPDYVRTQVYLPDELSNPRVIRDLRRRLQTDLPEIAGVKLEVGEHMWGGRGGDEGMRMVHVALHGEDPEYLEDLALDVERKLRELPGAQEVYGPTLRGRKEARLIVDPESARQLGVSPQAVASTVSTAFRGRRIRRFHGTDGEIEMVLGLSEEAKPGLAALMELPVAGTDGPPVTLGSVVFLEVMRTPPDIQRVDRETTTWISVQFDAEEVTTEDGRELVTGRLAGLRLPVGYSWDFGDWGERHDEGLTTMRNGVAISLLVVLILMMALFESITQPFSILITLPLAFSGAFWSLWLFGFDLDVVAFIGVIILIGTVVNNGIVMVDHVNALRREGKGRVDALLEGCGNRLRPVMMTAITTIFGLLPLGLSGATVAGVYIDSIAVAMIGGLASSTVFTLIALPVWYTFVEDFGSALFRIFFGWIPARH